jgi:hypothetical protein
MPLLLQINGLLVVLPQGCDLCSMPLQLLLELLLSQLLQLLQLGRVCCCKRVQLLC